uniref:Peptidase S1 domain-containing protein n=1 Tax=Propithecus coquereli TaxID=379532 RepID=A0A2K6GGX2_PROCO
VASFLAVFGACGTFPGNRFRYSVKMGDRSIHEKNTSLVVPVKNVIVHPQFATFTTVENDLAILKLLYSVNFTSNIQPICIPRETFQVEAGTKFWGPHGL